MQGKIVTRIAPSPTGLMHCGTLRTALYNYLIAKKVGGVFYLRIEDTDQKRFVPEAEDYIRRSFEWAGIEPDFSPWKPGPGEFAKMRQSERDYSQHIDKLLTTGHAYLAFDTEQELSDARATDPHFAYDSKTRMRMRNSLTLPPDEVADLVTKVPHVVRFKVPQGVELSFDDEVRGVVTFRSDDVDDKVLVKSNGIPTYHLASVCDDHNMGTTHVIRGEEWLPSTPLHVLLYRAFGWDAPKFGHLPTILRPDGRGKFSKRDALKYDVPIFPFGGEAIDDKGNLATYKGYADEGYDPAAILNFLLLLGWAPEDGREMFTLQEMVDAFSLDRVHKAGARYDIEKAKWFNQRYLQSRDEEYILSMVDIDRSTYDHNRLFMIADLARSRSTFPSDLQQVVDIFRDVDTQPTTPSLATETLSILTEFSGRDSVRWDSATTLKESFFSICQDSGIKPAKVLPALRTVVARGVPGPDLFTTMYVLGQSRTASRIKRAMLVPVS
jgi:glutamyl-tRNA synthetase